MCCSNSQRLQCLFHENVTRSFNSALWTSLNWFSDASVHQSRSTRLFDIKAPLNSARQCFVEQVCADTQAGDFPPRTGSMRHVPQDDQRDETQRCGQHEDKGGIPCHRSRIHGVEDCNRRVGCQTLNKRQKGKKGTC